MKSSLFRLRQGIRQFRVFWLLAGACVLVAIGAPALVHALTSANNLAVVDLTGNPLYAGNASAKPTLTLALSVEYPTVGAQYQDASYSATQAYVGYFDNASCYTYNNNADAGYRRFDRSGAAVNRKCASDDSFSGNFMNWATTSAIDLLRLGLTGGDRIVDEATLTVLQRAVLPTDQGSFWNGSNFPSKTITAANAAGSIPKSLRGTYSGTIYIANCLNRVHFGTSATGSCGAPGDNSNLGVTRQDKGTVTYASSLPSGFTECASENGYCDFSGIKRVYYGATYLGTNRWYMVTASNGITCSNGVFGDPFSGVAKKCYVGTTTDSWKPATVSGSAQLTDDSFFYTRVQVCKSASGTLDNPDEKNCTRYPNNYYKPVGNLQKYSDRVRVAAFGYLIDNNQTRYGGVLRAPMKFVGPTTYDTATNQASVNANVEWDANTGIFKTNPEARAENQSGVINYLNKFGRLSGSATYKVYDPVAELYYEALRYVQGLQPTKNAYDGWTSDMAQNFPVYTQWTDPWANGSASADYSCVRNNILTIGDQNTHNDKSIPGNTTLMADNEFSRAVNVKGNEPDFRDWSNRIGNTLEPTTLNNPYPQNLGNLGEKTYNEGATNPGYYMAGMAYWAHVNDIRGTAWTASPTQQRPGMRVTTYVLDVNEYNSQSSDAARRRRSPYFLAAKYGGFLDAQKTGTPFTTGNTWQKTGSPGEARTYFVSNSEQAQGVLDALDSIFVSIAAEANSIAGGALSSSQLSSTATGYLYRAQFDATNWSGDVVATTLSTSTSSNTTALTVGSTAWSAANRLTTRSTARNIVVGNTNHGTTIASSFAWGSIESTLQASLNKASPSATASDGYGEARLNYLLGARTNEGSRWRTRTSLLGDIINSGVVLSGSPSTDIIDTDYYGSTLYKAARTPTLYVGANDGMLHAFNANTGDELFGYIPSWVGPKLSQLTSSTYVGDGHQSFVDATPAVAEAKVGNDWKTVLVSGTGAGGQGVFALDVSAPSNFSASKVMWEFTDKDNNLLGNVIGSPQILKFAVKSGNTVAYKWFAVVASGVNSYASDDGVYSTAGTPSLFLLDLAHDGRSAWVENTDYYRISLPAASGAKTAAGVADFTPVLGTQGEVRSIYAGDLHGQLWRLNSSTAGLPTLPTGNDLPLFVARAPDNTRQPITTAPSLLRAGNNVVVAFGTGKYLEASDTISTQTQSFYAILDAGDTAQDGSTGGIIGKSRLLQVTNKSGVISAGSFKWGKSTAWGTGIYAGWYYDFPASSERQVADGVLSGNSLYFNSLIPLTAGSDACSGGSANSYAINVAQGTVTVSASQIGLLASPLTLDIGDAAYSSRNSVGQRTKTITTRIVQQGSSGVSADASAQKTLTVGRLSWRQIPNYQQLHNQATQ